MFYKSCPFCEKGDIITFLKMGLHHKRILAALHHLAIIVEQSLSDSHTTQNTDRSYKDKFISIFDNLIRWIWNLFVKWYSLLLLLFKLTFKMSIYFRNIPQAEIFIKINFVFVKERREDHNFQNIYRSQNCLGWRQHVLFSLDGVET